MMLVSLLSRGLLQSLQINFFQITHVTIHEYYKQDFRKIRVHCKFKSRELADDSLFQF